MKGYFWFNGRLSWLLVCGVAYVSASIVVFDAVWRTVSLPFDTLLLYLTATDMVLAALLIALYVVCTRRIKDRG